MTSSLVALGTRHTEGSPLRAPTEADETICEVGDAPAPRADRRPRARADRARRANLAFREYLLAELKPASRLRASSRRSRDVARALAARARRARPARRTRAAAFLRAVLRFAAPLAPRGALVAARQGVGVPWCRPWNGGRTR